MKDAGCCGVQGTGDGFETGGVEINLGGFQRGVAHLLLDDADIDAIAQEAGGERMAQGVRVDALGDVERLGGLAESGNEALVAAIPALFSVDFLAREKPIPGQASEGPISEFPHERFLRMWTDDSGPVIGFPLPTAGADLEVKIGDKELGNPHGAGLVSLGLVNGDHAVREADVFQPQSEHVALDSEARTGKETGLEPGDARHDFQHA